MRFPSFIPHISAIILLFTVSCSTTTITDPVELPYEEKIVVRGVLTAGQPVKDIMISRTVPVLAPQTQEEFWVKDADAVIVSDGKSYPLILQPFPAGQAVQRTMYAASGLTAEQGKTYTLTVRWHGKTVTATTRIPVAPMLVSAKLLTVVVPSFTIGTITVSTNGTMQRPTTGSIQIRAITDTALTAEAVFLPKEQANYRAGLELRDTARNLAVTGFYLGGLLTNENIVNGMLTVPSATLPSQTRKLVGGTVAARLTVYVLDPQYERYYATRNRANQSGFNLFGGASDSNVEWNVQGDGLGLFLGLVETNILLRP
jgi:hypothetical protein